MAGFASVQKPAGLLYPSKRYAPLQRCAYCDATDNLSDEHIIPFGLGGALVLPKSSCEKHRKATSKVGDFVLRRYLCPLRSHLGLPSRKPHLRPDGYSLILKRGTHSWKQKVGLKDHPGMVRFVIFEAPGRVAGRRPVQQTYSFRLTTATIFPDIDQRLARLGADGSVRTHAGRGAKTTYLYPAKLKASPQAVPASAATEGHHLISSRTG